MKIKFACDMNFEVFYQDGVENHTFRANQVYNVSEGQVDEPVYGRTVFVLDGDQDGLWDGGVIEVPNPAFNEVT